MTPEQTSAKPSFMTGFLRGTRKVIKWLIILVLIFGAGMVYWKYFFTYSEGYRAGLLQKFSNKGAIFKTYEGEIILSSIAGTRDVTIASEKFHFSVTNRSLVRQFDTLQGQNVIVHYTQKNAPAFWRGDSPYLVDSIKVRR